MLDIDAIRSLTPGVEHVAHLNNCGSSLPSRPVVDAMVDYLRAEELNGGYETAADRSEDLDRFYPATASLLSCSPDEVAFCSGAAEAWWRAFSSVPLSAGDRILVNSGEYQANAFGWMQARDRGVEVDLIANDDFGIVDLDALEAMIDERVKLVSFTMISLGNGAIQPAAAAAERVRSAGSDAIFLLDACQAAGQLSLDVRELGCDFLIYTGRKFMRGPRGTGALFARADVLDRLGPPIFVDGRSAVWTEDNSYRPVPGAGRFEFGEFNFAGKVGLGVATDYAVELGLDAIAARVASLADQLREQLSSIDGVTVHDEGIERCGIVTFTIAGVESATVAAELRDRSINVSVPQRAAAQLDLGARGLASVVRCGVHYFNTNDELDRLCDAVETVQLEPPCKLKHGERADNQ